MKATEEELLVRETILSYKSDFDSKKRDKAILKMADEISVFLKRFAFGILPDREGFVLMPIPSSNIQGFCRKGSLLVDVVSKRVGLIDGSDFPVYMFSNKPIHLSPVHKKPMQNYFLLRKKIEGKNIILLDDIVTTGNTAKLAIELIKLAGGKTVFCLFYAKTKRFPLKTT